MNHHHDHHTPADLRLIDEGHTLGDADALDISRGLDALGAAERHAAPAGLGDRVFLATHDILGPRVVARLSASGARHHDRPRWGGLLTPVRAAAGLALAATVGISILAGRIDHLPVARATPQDTPFERYIDAWASNTNELGGDLAARASALDADTSALHDSLTGGASSYDLWAEEGAL